MISKMLKKYVVLIAGLFLAVSAEAQTKSFQGTDQNGLTCQLILNNLKFGKIVKRDPCFFEIDGRGPWCEGQARIPTVTMSADGVYRTEKGSVTFAVNDQYVILDQNGKMKGFNGDDHGGTVSVKVQDEIMTVYYYFPTNFGRTLSAEEINQALSSSKDYESTWNKIYNNVTCTIK